MHTKYREPINKKYLIISIIGVVIFAIFFAIFTPNMSSTTKKVASRQTTPEYTSIKKSLDKKFNQNGPVVKIKTEQNINDSTSKHPHSVIVIRLTDKQTQKYLKTSYEAVQSGQATDDQKMYVYSIQDIVSKQAKKLDNNYDVIQFVYKDGNKFVPVVSSQKGKFLIKPVKLTNKTN